jgi:spore cortex formation protein SpoVR/YcgB (stage V sporulation)
MSKKYDHYRSFTVRLNTNYADEKRLADKLDALIETDKKEHGHNVGGLRRMLPEMVDAYTNQRAKVKPLTPERRIERFLSEKLDEMREELGRNLLEILQSVAVARPGLLTKIDNGDTNGDDDSDLLNEAFVSALETEFEGRE